MLPARRNETTPTLRDPFEDFERLGRSLLSWADAWHPTAVDGFLSALGDLEETDDAFLLEVDLPGVEKGDVDVEVDGRRVVVTAERKERERTGVLRRRTRTVGTYRHEAVLPLDVDADAVEAKLSDGVLTITLPKQDASQRRRITVR